MTDFIEKPERKPHGTSTLSPEERTRIARLGGQAVPPEKRTFSTHPGLAKRAGAAGGRATQAHKRSFAVNPELAREAALKSVAVRRAKAEKSDA
jgi:general stress protein YciG